MSQNEIIEPHVFQNKNNTAQSYKKMLRHYVITGLRVYVEDMIVQQNGTPPQYAVAVQQFVTKSFKAVGYGEQAEITILHIRQS